MCVCVCVCACVCGWWVGGCKDVLLVGKRKKLAKVLIIYSYYFEKETFKVCMFKVMMVTKCLYYKHVCVCLCESDVTKHTPTPTHILTCVIPSVESAFLKWI